MKRTIIFYCLVALSQPITYWFFFCARVRIAHCCFWLGLMQLKLAEFQTQFSKRKWFMKNSHNLLSVWSATRGKQLNNENFTNGMHMIGSVRKTARFSFLWNTVRMCVVCLCARYKWAVSFVGAEKSNGYEHLSGIFSSDQSFWNRATKFSHYSCAPLSGFNDYEPHTHFCMATYVDCVVNAFANHL